MTAVAPLRASILAGLLLAAATPARAQHHGHAMPAPAPPVAPAPTPAVEAPADAPADAPEDPHAGMDHAAMDHAAMDHAAMGHATMDHAAMGHAPAQSESAPDADAAPPADLPADASPRTPIPPVSAADQAAAFPTLASGHPAHDLRAKSYWLVDRLELRDEGGDGAWEGTAWRGGDLRRLWLRTEGEVHDGRVEHGAVELLFGQSASPWWDLVAGLRQDLGEGPSRTWAAVGVQGLAPYKFELQATGYVGDGGRSAASVEAEYDTLLTNRLVLQWRGEGWLYGHDDPEAAIGSGLSTVALGLRLRYEVTRRFAPYLGIEAERSYGDTARLRTAQGEERTDTRIVMGVRFWF